MSEKKKAERSPDEQVEEIKITDAGEAEGTDVKIDEVKEVKDASSPDAEEARPKPVPKGSRRGSKSMQLEIDRLKELAAGNEEKYKRLLAEFENARQRHEKESLKHYDIGAKEVLEKLLPVVDNFERALGTVPEEDKNRAFEQGIDKIYKQMMSAFDDIGVAPMNAVGKYFDPEFHNAVIHIEDENVGENIIVEEMQKGYMYKDQVLRHAMVKVAN